MAERGLFFSLTTSGSARARRNVLRAALLAGIGLAAFDLAGRSGYADSKAAPAAATQPAACPPAKPAATTQPAATQPSPAVVAAAKNEELTGWILDLLQRYQPDLYAKAVTLQKSDPKKLDALLRNAVPNFRDLKTEQISNPPLFQAYMQNLKLSYETLELAKKIKSMDGASDEKAALKQELTQRVSEQFDVWQQIRFLQLDELMAKVEKLRKAFDARAVNKDALVNKRVDDLMKPSPPLNW